MLMVLYIIFSISLFVVKSINYHAVLAGIVTAVLFQIPINKVKSGLLPILLLLFFTFAGNLLFHPGRIIYETFFAAITDEGLYIAGIRTLRVFSMIFAAKILTHLLPLDRMLLSIVRIAGPLERAGLPVRDFFEIMGLTLKALPVLTQRLSEAYREDLGKNSIRGFRNRLRHLVSFMLPVFTESIHSPEEFIVSKEPFIKSN